MENRKIFDTENGSVTLYASKYDQRFSYYVYVPSSYEENQTDSYPLTIVVHGTERSAEKYRDNFIDYAEENNTFILAPLFPAGIIEYDDIHSYKFLKFHDLRYDLVLLEMVNEISEKYRIMKEKFLLYGFSGGGHFVHRFYYLHPERLLAVSIGSPGRITYLENDKPWYNGVSDIELVFKKSIDYEELKRVEVQLIVGGEDKDTSMINNPNDPTFDKEAGRYGETRIERLRALKQNLNNIGILTEYIEVPGVAHEGFKLTDEVKKFFQKVLEK